MISSLNSLLSENEQLKSQLALLAQALDEKQKLLTQKDIILNETPVKVLVEKGQTKKSKGYIWVVSQ